MPTQDMKELIKANTKQKSFLKYRIKITEHYDQIRVGRGHYQTRHRFWTVSVKDSTGTLNFRADSKTELLNELRMCLYMTK